MAKDIFDLVVPIGDRVATVQVMYRTWHDAERCAARTTKGTQCEHALNSGEGGGHYEINGLQIPLCTIHLRKARAEQW